MTRKIILATTIVIAIAFITGAITTGTTAFAATDFSRSVKVLDDDFETFSGWNNIGTGTVIQLNVGSTDAVSGDNVGRKTLNNDPNGAIKQLSQTLNDFEVVLYSKKVNTVGGDALRYSVVQDVTGNGYGFYLTNGALVIEERTANFGQIELARLSQSWTLGEWNTFRFIKTGNTLTLEFYKDQIVDSAIIGTVNPTSTFAVNDVTFQGGFNFASINGGHAFDTDDYQVWELIQTPTPDFQSQIDNLNKRITSLESGLVDCTNLVPGANLVGCAISNNPGIDLSGANLRVALMDNADLSGANFTRAELYFAGLNSATLPNANFTFADLSFADLSGTDLSGTTIAIATLLDTLLPNADLTNANLSRSFLVRAFVADADLSGANLSNAVLDGTFFGNADLSNADLTGTTLFGTNFTGATLTGADFTGSNLQNAFGGPFVGCIGHSFCV